MLKYDNSVCQPIYTSEDFKELVTVPFYLIDHILVRVERVYDGRDEMEKYISEKGVHADAATDVIIEMINKCWERLCHEQATVYVYTMSSYSWFADKRDYDCEETFCVYQTK